MLAIARLHDVVAVATQHQRDKRTQVIVVVRQ
jgi:hypothetical protein